MLNFAVKRAQGVIVLFVTLFLFGMIAFLFLPRERFPRLEYPVITAVTFMENFSPTEIKNLVTRPMEEILAGVPHLKKMESSSFEGVSVIRLSFEWGSSIDDRYFDVRERLDYCKSILPQYASRPLALKTDIDDAPILVIRVNFQDEMVRGNERSYLKKTIVPFLKTIEGVARVGILGGDEKEVQINVDHEKLYGHQLDLEDVVRVVTENHVEFPVGNFISGGREYQVRLESVFRDHGRFGSLIVGQNRNGDPLFLSQVATVQLGTKEPLVLYRSDGERAVALLIYKEGNANIVQTAHAVEKALRNIERQNLVTFTFVRNEAALIEASLKNISYAVLIGILIVMGVLYLFLRNLTSALIVAAVIPVSLGMTFLCMYILGMSLNFISILGVSLSLGTMVDNNIVFVDMYRREGSKGVYALLKRLAGPLVVSQFTNVAIFLPVLSIRGIGGALFGELAGVMFIVTVCVILEMLFLTPALLHIFGRNTVTTPHHAVSTRLKAMTEQYKTSIRWVIKRRYTLVSLMIGLLVVSLLVGVFFIERTFLPVFGEKEFVVEITHPPNTSLLKSEEITAPVEQLLLRQEGINGISTVFGRYVATTLFHRQIEPNYVEMRVFCRDVATARRIRKWFEQRAPNIFPNADVVIKEPENFFTKIWEEKKEITISGTAAHLVALQEKIYQKLLNMKAHQIQRSPPEIYTVTMKMDRTLLNHHGLSAKKVGNTALIAFEGKVATTMENQEGIETDVRVRLTTNVLSDLDTMKKLLVKKPDNSFVHLGDFVSLSHEYQQRELTRKNQRDSVKVSFEMKPSLFARFKKWLGTLRLHDATMDFSWDSLEMRRALSQLVWCFFISVVLIFCLVMVQFNNLKLTAITLSSIPFIFLGVIPILFVTGNSINVVSLLGMIMLIGLVINGAIFLLEEMMRIREQRDFPTAFIHALEEAASKRLVPVLLTTLTTVLSLLPMIFFPGVGMEYQRVLALSLFGGLSVSTLFTLYAVPLLYAMTTLRKWK